MEYKTKVILPLKKVQEIDKFFNWWEHGMKYEDRLPLGGIYSFTINLKNRMKWMFEFVEADTEEESEDNGGPSTRTTLFDENNNILTSKFICTSKLFKEWKLIYNNDVYKIDLTMNEDYHCEFCGTKYNHLCPFDVSYIPQN